MLSLLPATQSEFRAKYGQAPLDVAAFRRRYKRCVMEDCQGHCCSSGVSIEEREKPVIDQLVKDHAAFFTQHLPSVGSEMVIWDEEDEAYRTNVRPFQYKKGVLPEGFNHESCVFRDDRGACMLQRLGHELGHDSWWYKPVWCWLFPISLETVDGVPFITIPSPESDTKPTPDYRPTADDQDYAEFTAAAYCGKACQQTGTPGHIIFAQELKQLSELLGRDLIGEILGENLAHENKPQSFAF